MDLSDVGTCGAVVCAVLERATVGRECVMCGVMAVLGVSEVVLTSGVPVTATVE